MSCGLCVSLRLDCHATGICQNKSFVTRNLEEAAYIIHRQCRQINYVCVNKHKAGLAEDFPSQKHIYHRCATRPITISLAGMCQPWQHSVLWSQWQCKFIFILIWAAPMGGTPEEDSTQEEEEHLLHEERTKRSSTMPFTKENEPPFFRELKKGLSTCRNMKC